MMEENLLSHSKFFALMFSFKRIYFNINNQNIFLYLNIEIGNLTKVSWAYMFVYFQFPFYGNITLWKCKLNNIIFRHGRLVGPAKFKNRFKSSLLIHAYA